jgi:hypothetical protein
MQVKVRPEVAASGEPGVVLEGEELETVLSLAERSRQYDLANARQLKQARDLALHVRRTGHLPAELPA